MHIDSISFIVVSIFITVNVVKPSSHLYRSNSEKNGPESHLQGLNQTKSDEIKSYFHEGEVYKKKQWSNYERDDNVSESLKIEDESQAQSLIYNEQISINPFMAYVRAYLGYKNLNCAGTIVTKMHVLTAAKCLYDDKRKTWAKPSMVDVAVGGTYPFRDEKKLYTPHILYPNKEYPKTHNIDIAVIELKKELTFSPTVNTIRLAGPTQMSFLHEMIHNHKKMIVLGWGSEKDPNIIQHMANDKPTIDTVSIRLLAHFTILTKFKQCKFKIKNFDVNIEVCAERKGLKKSKWCPGTRGGPVIWNQQQFGLVSRGTCINKKRNFLVFSRIDTLRGYIDANFYKSGRYKGCTKSSGAITTLQVKVFVTIILFILFTDLQIFL